MSGSSAAGRSSGSKSGRWAKLTPAQMVTHGQAIRHLVLHFAGCLFSLPLRSAQILWIAAGIGTSRPGSAIEVARTLHMSPASERAAEGRAITQLRAAGRGGCQAGVSQSASPAVTAVDVALPAAFLATAAQTVGSRPSAHSIGHSRHVASRTHRHRRAIRGAALEAAAIDSSTHDSVLTVWALVLLAALGISSIVAMGSRRRIRWRGGLAAALLDGGRGGLSSIGRRRSTRRSSTGSPAVSPIAVLPLTGTTADGTASNEQITAPPDGWAPPFFAHSEAAPAEEISAPPGGWAPPLFAGSEAAPIEEITAPPGGWAPPIRGVTAPFGPDTRPGLTSHTRRRTVAGWRELRAHPATTLRVAGGALAAILALAAKPQRGLGRRHR